MHVCMYMNVDTYIYIHVYTHVCFFSKYMHTYIRPVILAQSSLSYDAWHLEVYFILTQLPAREDDRPGGGPRYTLPRCQQFQRPVGLSVHGASKFQKIRAWI